VKIAFGFLDMLLEWQSSPIGALVHCDFYTHQFGLTHDNVPRVADVDGLLRAPYAKRRRCTGALSCAHNCYRGARYNASVVRSVGSVDRTETVHVVRACSMVNLRHHQSCRVMRNSFAMDFQVQLRDCALLLTVY
jgi:hypothetical protein